LTDLHDNVVTKAEHKIGENNNHNSKNKSLFQLLNHCLLELNQSMAKMRSLQECILVTDHKYRVSFVDSSELDEFNSLRTKLSKKVDATKLFDILTVQIAQEDQPPAEFDKSFMEQKNDSSRIGELITSKELLNPSQRALDGKPHILESEFLRAAPQTMVLDGVSVKRKTTKGSQETLKGRPDSSNNAKTWKESNNRMSFTTSIKGMVSDPKLGSSQNLLKSAMKNLSKEVEIEDADTFSSNVRNAPQRMVQKRRRVINTRF
jgi:hypothetical protein